MSFGTVLGCSGYGSGYSTSYAFQYKTELRCKWFKVQAMNDETTVLLSMYMYTSKVLLSITGRSAVYKKKLNPSAQ
jgi:hypothetical protein